jgi:hypothetical protein
MAKVAELEGVQLNYWVARVEGYEYVDVPPDANGRNEGRALLPPGLLASGWKFPPKGPVGDCVPNFSSSWERGGPIIDREAIGFGVPTQGCNEYQAFVIRDRIPTIAYGLTHLIAAMRLVVKLKYGDEVPNEKE